MNGSDGDCVVCGNALSEGDEFHLLPCDHMMHAVCMGDSSGHCPADNQILDLSKVSNQKLRFSSTFIETPRLERLKQFPCSNSYRNIAWIYLHEVEEEDLEKAVTYLQRALQADSSNVNASLELANCYKNGTGVAVDEGRARELDNRASEHKKAVEIRNSEFLASITKQPNPHVPPEEEPHGPTGEDATGNREPEDQMGVDPSEDEIESDLESFVLSQERNSSVDASPSSDVAQFSGDEFVVVDGDTQMKLTPGEQLISPQASQTQPSQDDSNQSTKLEKSTTETEAGCAAASEFDQPDQLVANLAPSADVTKMTVRPLFPTQSPECQKTVTRCDDENVLRSQEACVATRKPRVEQEGRDHRRTDLEPEGLEQESVGKADPKPTLDCAEELNPRNSSRLRSMTRESRRRLKVTQFVPRLSRRHKRLLQESGLADFRSRTELSPDDSLLRRIPLYNRRRELHSLEALFWALGDGTSGTVVNSGTSVTIRDYYEAYRQQRTNPSKILEECMQQIESPCQKGVNAIVRTNIEDARRQAWASSERWKQGKPLSILDGVPFIVTDSLDVQNYPTGLASKHLSALHKEVVKEDCDVVKALKNVGMMMIAKCNEDELCSGVRGYSESTGQTLNPHNKDYITAGSSGGCAAAVADLIVPVSVACDTAGGIRIPAAACGVFGLKATFSRISMFGQAFHRLLSKTDNVSSLCNIGPVTGCAEDLALTYHTLAAYAPNRSTMGELRHHQRHQPIPEFLKSDVTGLRVGVLERWPHNISENASKAFDAALSNMHYDGASIFSININTDLRHIHVAVLVTLVTELRESLCSDSDGRKRNIQLGSELRDMLEIEKVLTPDDLKRAEQLRAKLMDLFERKVFREVDVVVTPAVGSEIPSMKQAKWADFKEKAATFAEIASLTGVPACVIPVLKDDQTGLPYGVQVLAAPWNESKLLRVCLWAQKKFPRNGLKPYGPIAAGSVSKPYS